jgi:hypothetical protein
MEEKPEEILYLTQLNSLASLRGEIFGGAL